jgi:hypothetical protein
MTRILLPASKETNVQQTSFRNGYSNDKSGITLQQSGILHTIYVDECGNKIMLCNDLSFLEY